MTPIEKQSIKATALIFAIVLVVGFAPAFILGAKWLLWVGVFLIVFSTGSAVFIMVAAAILDYLEARK